MIKVLIAFHIFPSLKLFTHPCLKHILFTCNLDNKAFFRLKTLSTNFSGLLNEGFHDEDKGEKGTIDTADVLHTPVILEDGFSLSEYIII